MPLNRRRPSDRGRRTLIAVPGANAVLIVEAIAIFAAAEGAGLVLVGELLGGKGAEV
jgi:hypothetical protein